MPAEEPTSSNGHDSIDVDRDDSDRWEYTGDGFGEFRSDLARAGIDDEPFRITIHAGSQSASDVSLAIVTDEDDGEPHMGAAITLSPDQADLLGHDLIAQARDVRQRGDE